MTATVSIREYEDPIINGPGGDLVQTGGPTHDAHIRSSREERSRDTYGRRAVRTVATTISADHKAGDLLGDPSRRGARRVHTETAISNPGRTPSQCAQEGAQPTEGRPPGALRGAGSTGYSG